LKQLKKRNQNPNVYEQLFYADSVRVMENKCALISVFDKEGIVDFARELSKFNIQVISSGGTATILEDSGINVKEVSELTGFPEMLDGRVKTLHPIVHAGILARRDTKAHMDTLLQHKEVLKSKKEISLELRKKLAIEAYSHTAQYDSIISQYLQNRWTEEILPENPTFTMRKIQDMRYGENPHQKGAFYKALPIASEPCISNAKQLQGKELSFNNILDSDCTIECIKEFTEPTCVIVKHATPCGVASASTMTQSWKDAFATDIYSPFGGIVAFNREVPKEVAEELSGFFLEVIIAPSFSESALKIFGKKKNLRLLELKGLDKKIKRKGVNYRSVVGGFLAQERDIWLNEKKNWKIVTEKKPSQKDLDSMEFAVKCVKHVKSNSVLFVKDMRTVAIGGGQTSRVDAAWIATHKGKENINDSIMASDAFFPFRDAVDVAAKAGVKAIIQPGGSIRDKKVIEAANEHGIAMVFSGQRYFRH